jgi:hypothetical protein
LRGLSSSLPYASKHHVALNAPRHCERRFLFQEPHVRRLLARAPQMHTRASRRNQWLAANLAARLVVPPAAQRSGQAATLLAAEIAGAGVCSGASALVSSVAICMCPSLFNLRIFVSSNFQIPLCFLLVNRKGVSGACSPGDLQRLPFFLGGVPSPVDLARTHLVQAGQRHFFCSHVARATKCAVHRSRRR